MVWTAESVITTAKSFKSKTEFNRTARGAYDAAKRLKVFDKATEHMRKKEKAMRPTKWTIEAIKEEAKKYSSRWEFGKNCRSAYEAALRYEVLDSVCLHMQPSRKKNLAFTFEELKTIAARYSTKADFRRNDSEAYWFYVKRPEFKLVTAHMQTGYKSYDVNRPGTVYLLKISDTVSDEYVFKVGVTNHTAEERARFLGAKALKNVCVVAELHFSSGEVALAVEQEIHLRCEKLKALVGTGVIKRGKTELYRAVPVPPIWSLSSPEAVISFLFD